MFLRAVVVVYMGCQLFLITVLPFVLWVI